MSRLPLIFCHVFSAASTVSCNHWFMSVSPKLPGQFLKVTDHVSFDFIISALSNEPNTWKVTICWLSDCLWFHIALDANRKVICQAAAMNSTHTLSVHMNLLGFTVIFPFSLWKMQGYFSQLCAMGWGWNNQNKKELIEATLQRKED